MRAAGLAVAGLMALSGCGEPTCETTCDKIFNTCGFDYEGDGLSKEAHEVACVSSCRNTLSSAEQESETVVWMTCVQVFSCEGLDDPNGYALREACPPDAYYVGQYATSF